MKDKELRTALSDIRKIEDKIDALACHLGLWWAEGGRWEKYPTVEISANSAKKKP